MTNHIRKNAYTDDDFSYILEKLTSDYISNIKETISNSNISNIIFKPQYFNIEMKEITMTVKLSRNNSEYKLEFIKNHSLIGKVVFLVSKNDIECYIDSTYIIQTKKLLMSLVKMNVIF